MNSLAPGKFKWNFRCLILQIILVIDGWGISCGLALRWMPLELTDDKSTLVQVMAWCRQATSHYLSQCWPRSLSPYGVTRPQWVKQYLTAILSKMMFSFAKILLHWSSTESLPFTPHLIDCHTLYQIMACINNYIVWYFVVCSCSTMAKLKGWFNQTIVEFKKWNNDYIPLFYVNVMTYPCRNPMLV